MGICISLKVSKSVSEERWQKVYDEALFLAKKLNLAEIRTVKIHGHQVSCLAKTKESEWYGERGFMAIADYEYGDAAESFFFPKEISSTKTQEPIDALECTAYDIGVVETNPDSDDCIDIWGNKTQEMYYHFSILAIGCLVQDRLKDEAYVYGDFNAGQCRVAVKDANEFLKKPIQVPCQCDPNRWMERISRLTVKGTDKVRIAECMYIGKKDAAFGEKLRALLPSDVLTQYWKEEMNYYQMRMFGFMNCFKRYLEMGFDIAELCDIISFKDEDGNDMHEYFIHMILDAKMHWKEKDCSDILVQDPDDPKLYGIDGLLFRTFAIGQRNKKVDRYIPIDELRGILKEKLGQACDVDAIMDAYLRNENESEDDSESRKITMNILHEEREKNDALSKEYQIYDAGMLQKYEPGWKIEPSIEEAIQKVMDFAESLPKQQSYRQIAQKSVQEIENWLSKISFGIYGLRDRDWQRIFTNLEKDPKSVKRYCSLFLIKQDSSPVREVVQALIINDDLYEYACLMMEKAKAVA